VDFIGFGIEILVGAWRMQACALKLTELLNAIDSHGPRA
jgi:hypothetical protein